MQLPQLDGVNQDSPYLRQHRAGFRRLRFDGELEQAFNRYHLSVFLVRMRWALLVALLLVVLFVVLDTISLPEAARNPALVVRFGLMVPMLLIAWLATYWGRLQPYLQPICAGAALACGLGLGGIIWIAHAHDSPVPHGGIMLATMFFYSLTGLRFVAAALCGWLTFFIFLLGAVFSGLPAEQLLYDLAFLGSANLIGCFGCYFLEYATRQNFLAQGLLQDLAERDFLTGLCNRRAFSARAERSWQQAVRERQPLALAMLDVDFFKRYNDHYGHAAGDEALHALAQVIGRHARRPLDIAARYGGEEFVGLWYGLDEGGVLSILESIRAEVEALGRPHVQSEAAAVVTLSIGLVYLLPQPQQSLEDALHQADMALYLAKEQGRNRVVSSRPGSQPL